jgi:DNA-directed RNA polymerase specialized sigma24 family protein
MQKHDESYSSRDSESGQPRHASLKSITSPCDCLGISPDDSDPCVDEVLERYNFAYILAQVKRIAHLHAKIAHPAVLDLELEDIAQEVHIRLWQKLQIEPIENHEAYIRQMICHAFTDVMRRQKRRGATIPLPTLPDGELFMEDVLNTFSEGIPSTESEVEQKEAAIRCAEKAAVAISMLPPRQKSAIACFLYERLDDPRQFKDIFRSHGINIETARWPAERAEKRLLKASISVARHTIARCMNVDLCLYKQKGASYISGWVREVS